MRAASNRARGYPALMSARTAAVAADLAPDGTLRAAINLGNPVLAQGTAMAPTGATVDIAREIGARLGLPVEFTCFDAARDSFAAVTTGRADICFLAIEPARAAEVAFTAPYVLIEGVYAVSEQSPLVVAADVDRPGVRIGVNRGSAYDLFLTRTLQHATLVRGTEGTTEFLTGNLEAAAGVREPMTEFAASNPGYRLIEGRFMEIRQAVGTAASKRPETVAFLHALVEELKAGGFVADALRRSGQTAPVAPPQ
jgi:polar amino acid transport system substrate-binding protein